MTKSNASINTVAPAQILLPFKSNWLVHNILEHTAQHVDSRVPLYELPAAQAKLNEAYSDNVIVAYLTPRYVWTLLQTCQFYDFENHCWLDRRGRPTSSPAFNDSLASGARRINHVSS